MVDDADYDVLMKYRWWFSACKGHSIGYAVRCFMIKGKRHTILMHRFLMTPADSQQCDHIDGYGLNNQRSNLRNCSHMENHRNLAIHKSNLLGVRGISQPTTKVGYFARITVHYCQIYLGYFPTLEQAVEARKKAELEHFGEYRRKNIS